MREKAGLFVPTLELTMLLVEGPIVVVIIVGLGGSFVSSPEKVASKGAKGFGPTSGLGSSVLRTKPYRGS